MAQSKTLNKKADKSGSGIQNLTKPLNGNINKSGPPAASSYTRTYTSFSGNDMVCSFEIPVDSRRSVSRVVGTVQTITYSIHNDKMPVRVLGNMNARSFVFNGRIIAGSMIFTVFDRHWAKELLKQYSQETHIDAHYLIDELPSMNCTITMSNEYGQTSCLRIYGITFVNEGQVMSINDVLTENTFEYYAMDVDYLDDIKTNSGGTSKDSSISRLSEAKKSLETSGSKLDVPQPLDKQPSGTASSEKNNFSLPAASFYPSDYASYTPEEYELNAQKILYRQIIDVRSYKLTEEKTRRAEMILREQYNEAMARAEYYYKTEKPSKNTDKGSVT